MAVSNRAGMQKFMIVGCLFIITLCVLFLREPSDKEGFRKGKDGFEKEDSVLIPFASLMRGKALHLEQDDPRIAKYIWKHGYLQGPLDPSQSYNLTNPEKNPSMGQGQMIQKLFKNMREGFFIEAGGLDGETRSNTLFLEKELGWKGLLIEADPRNYALLQAKKRQAWTSNTCLATKPYPHEVIFQQKFNIGKIVQNSTTSENQTASEGYARVQCFPLFSLLNALKVFTVDYFSLDVEGVELGVLSAIPFDKVFIKTLSVEFSHLPGGKKALRSLMEEKGYSVVGEVVNKYGYAADFIFLHKSLEKSFLGNESSNIHLYGSN